MIPRMARKAPRWHKNVEQIHILTPCSNDLLGWHFSAPHSHQHPCSDCVPGHSFDRYPDLLENATMHDSTVSLLRNISSTTSAEYKDHNAVKAEPSVSLQTSPPNDHQPWTILHFSKPQHCRIQNAVSLWSLT